MLTIVALQQGLLEFLAEHTPYAPKHDVAELNICSRTAWLISLQGVDTCSFCECSRSLFRGNSSCNAPSAGA